MAGPSGPSPGYMADLAAAWGPFAAGEQLAGYGAPSPNPVMSGLPNAPPPPMLTPPNSGPPPAAPPPAGMSSPFEDPNGMVSRAPPAMTQGPAAVPTGVEPPKPAPRAPPGPPMPSDVQFAPVNIPGRPAHEVPTRGPTQNHLIESSFEPPMEAAQQIGLHSQLQAEHESSMYERMAQQAEDQQAAMQQVAVRRQQEMQARQADYDQTVQQLGEAKLDNNRLWANTSTMDKVATMALIAIGGFAGAGGGMLAALNKRLTDDVDAQKFDYEKGLNLAHAKQTAFGMAMQRFGSEDAAYNAAIAAGHQALAAKVGSMQAQWKGTDAANKATALVADQVERSRQAMAAGYAFLQPTAGSQGYQMSIRGQAIPGIVPVAKAQEYATTHGVKPAEAVDLAMVNGGITQTTEAMKLQAAQKKEDQYGPMGKAGSEKIALEQAQSQLERDANIRAIQAAESNVGALVKGGAVGNLAAHALPADAPGVTGAIKNMNAREVYNRRVMLSVAAAYKLSTDSTEPKRMELLQHTMDPYVIKPTDNEAVARQKINDLKRLVSESAESKGATPQALPSGVTKAAW